MTSTRSTAITLGVALAALASLAPAQARPPTVDISPGYDRALIESRKALADRPVETAAPAPPIVIRSRPIRRHRHRHD